MAWAVEQQEEAIWAEGERETARASFLELVVVNPDRARLAAYDLYPDKKDIAKAWEVAEWLDDPAFNAEVSLRLTETEEAKWLNDLREIAATAPQAKDKLKALELIGLNKGFIEKGGTTINDNRGSDQRQVKYIGVPMPVNDANEAAIEDAFHKQQTRLIEDARSRPS